MSYCTVHVCSYALTCYIVLTVCTWTCTWWCTVGVWATPGTEESQGSLCYPCDVKLVLCYQLHSTVSTWLRSVNKFRHTFLQYALPLCFKYTVSKTMQCTSVQLIRYYIQITMVCKQGQRMWVKTGNLTWTRNESECTYILYVSRFLSSCTIIFSLCISIAVVITLHISKSRANLIEMTRYFNSLQFVPCL